MPVSAIENPYAYKLIYVFRRSGKRYRGLLKIGDATLHTDLSREEALKQYPPNCPALQKAADERIRDYMGAGGDAWQILHTELALKTEVVMGKEGGFRDYTIHDILTHSGFSRVVFEKSPAREWFRVDLSIVLAAIQAAKAGREVLSAKESTPTFIPITLWPNQREAVDLAVARFNAGAPAVLWNAKMRFGKTPSAMMLVKEQGYKKVLICTHRPGVLNEWGKAYRLVFGDSDKYYFIEDETALRSELENIIYFASLQDLRGSAAVGGKFTKNELIYGTEWDLVIIDEAHEGTQTDLGQTVIEKLTKKRKTKVLALSGTPYNIMGDFPVENTYTWDYLAEEKAKSAWDKKSGCDNPYSRLPTMHILAYELSEHFKGNEALVTLEGYFSFSEFFRVSKATGHFVHEVEVKKFLALLCGAHAESNYPFATEAYRQAMRHTLWKLPGVPECDAMKVLLGQDPVFGNFEVVNVAGEGDVGGDSRQALEAVNDAIKKHEYTITLSCGRLTTGVTVPQWTGVLMLSGGDKVAASAYLQTIFRVQSPYTDEQGRIKEKCYAFDFAPDRTLTIMPKMCMNYTVGGQSGEPTRDQITQLLNFIPIIAIKGSELRSVQAKDIFYAIKRSVAARAIREGFADDSIYNKQMLGQANIKKEDFEDLKKIVGTLARGEVPNAVSIAATGVDKPKRKRGSRKPPKVKTPEDIAREKEREEREKAISILRAISIRIPLLIFGAEGPHDEDIGLREFMHRVAVDATQSWEAFMPKGVTWEIFEKFIPYYDDEIFRIALREIRARAKAADDYSPMARVKAISSIFASFRNPDKETVLTPWCVVNRQLADTIGGWCFFDEDFKEPLDEPRWVEHESVTKRLFDNPECKILEVNSKSGLYPLYVVYTLFHQRCARLSAQGETLTRTRQQEIWREVIHDHLYIVCQTSMAASITKRTLLGYQDGKVHLEVYADLIEDLRLQSENNQKVLRNITNPKTWTPETKETTDMHFDAIVGNPPYQAALGGASPLPVYHHFVELAIAAGDLVSLITPSRWFSTGTGLDAFREARMRDTHFRVLHDFIDSHMLFDRVEIKGGVNYFLWDSTWDGKVDFFLHESPTVVRHAERYLLEEGLDVFVRDERVLPILHKVLAQKEESFSTILSSQDPFGYDIRLPGSQKRAQHKFAVRKSKNANVAFYYNGWREDGIGYVSLTSVGAHLEWVDKTKVFLPKVWGTGDPRKSRVPAFIVDPPSVCTETYITLTPFKTRQEAENALSYIETKFFHFMVGIRKTSQNAAKSVYRFVPLLDFSKAWTDAELYAKYGLTEEEAAFIERMIPDAAAKERKSRK